MPRDIPCPAPAGGRHGVPSWGPLQGSTVQVLNAGSAR